MSVRLVTAMPARSVVLFGGIVVVGLVVDLDAEPIRRGRGVDVDLVYRGLPPE